MVNKKKWLIGMPFLFAIAAWGASSFLGKKVGGAAIAENSPIISYSVVLENAVALRKEWKGHFQNANQSEKAAVLRSAGSALGKFVAKDIFPHWVGTGWDFNGTSTEPKKGVIACGYFVTTLLEDAGINLPRVKLAQQASSVIMTSVAGGEKPKWLSGSPEEFEKKAIALPEGLYILGLDYHTGFLWIEGGQAYFLHSNYLPPQKVTMEKVVSSPAIAASKVKVVGKVSGSDYLVMHWLSGEAIPNP